MSDTTYMGVPDLTFVSSTLGLVIWSLDPQAKIGPKLRLVTDKLYDGGVSVSLEGA